MDDVSIQTDSRDRAGGLDATECFCDAEPSPGRWNCRGQLHGCKHWRNDIGGESYVNFNQGFGEQCFEPEFFFDSGVGAAASTNEMHTLSLAGATAGNYTVVVAVDCNSEVTQTNRSNDISAPTPLTVMTRSGLVIHPIFDTSITSDPNAMKITNGIIAALTPYQYLFSDPITVNIQFSKLTNGLGQSTTWTGTIAYSDFLTALADDSMTTNDAVAVNYLPGGTGNPVDGNPSMSLTTANLRALGVDVNPPTGQPDSIIALNFSIMNLSRASVDPTKYDLQSVVEHETDEALGFSSALNGLLNGAPPPSTPARALDLFRFDQSGARSF